MQDGSCAKEDWKRNLSGDGGTKGTGVCCFHRGDDLRRTSLVWWTQNILEVVRGGDVQAGL